MKISPTFYNEAGELMAPREVDVNSVAVFPGGKPTKEEGFYHRFMFHGATPAERAAKRERFFAEMGSVPRLMVLSIREYTAEIGTFKRYGVDVIYAIESPEGASKPNEPLWFLKRYEQA